jgi:hypothetical protein
MIRAEEQLASAHHAVTQVDTWENVYFLAEDSRHKTERAPAVYEAALRLRFCDIA